MIEEPTESGRFCGQALPDVAVCRIPSLDLVLIDSLLHVQHSLHPSWKQGIAFSVLCWKEASDIK